MSSSPSIRDEQPGRDRSPGVDAASIAQLLSQMQIMGKQMQTMSDHAAAQDAQVKSLTEHITANITLGEGFGGISSHGRRSSIGNVHDMQPEQLDRRL